MEGGEGHIENGRKLRRSRGHKAQSIDDIAKPADKRLVVKDESEI